MSKKFIILVLVLAMCFSLTACTITKKADTNKDGTNENQQDSSITAEIKIFPKDKVTISMLLPNVVSWPVQDDWFAIKAIEEATNVKLDIQKVDAQGDNYNTKFSLLVAAGGLPDIVPLYSVTQGNIYAMQGAFINVENYMSKTPNLKKWIEENKDHTDTFRASNGNLYAYPGMGSGIDNRRVWFYRKDIFEKHNLKLPETPVTPDGLYDILKKLKELYPDSYPLGNRSHGIELMSPSWHTMERVYYDFDNNKFVFGPVEDEWKEFLMFMNKLIKEQLTPPDMFSITTTGWIDLLVQNKAFITVDYVGRMDSVGASGKEYNPNFEFGFMPPVNGVAKYTAVEYGCTLVSSSSRKIDDVIKLMDWFYTDEAIELLTWGKEGKTYKIIDGKKQFIADSYHDFVKKYGLTTIGLRTVHKEDVIMLSYGKEAVKATLESPQYELRNNPVEYMQLTEAENEIKSTIGADIGKYASESRAQFILGEKSFDEWDAYVKEIEKMGLAKLLDMYTKAYERYK
ncbi:MAG TPA: extracellular solute-binding protein [Clostridiales bacterium]|nr:extracellular solute-binding protein [Clostridiales bacterium]